MDVGRLGALPCRVGRVKGLADAERPAHEDTLRDRPRQLRLLPTVEPDRDSRQNVPVEGLQLQPAQLPFQIGAVQLRIGAAEHPQVEHMPQTDAAVAIVLRQVREHIEIFVLGAHGVFARRAALGLLPRVAEIGIIVAVIRRNEPSVELDEHPVPVAPHQLVIRLHSLGEPGLAHQRPQALILLLAHKNVDVAHQPQLRRRIKPLQRRALEQHKIQPVLGQERPHLLQTVELILVEAHRLHRPVGDRPEHLRICAALAQPDIEQRQDLVPPAQPLHRAVIDRLLQLPRAPGQRRPEHGKEILIGAQQDFLPKMPRRMRFFTAKRFSR